MKYIFIIACFYHKINLKKKAKTNKKYCNNMEFERGGARAKGSVTNGATPSRLPD